ncbi:MAG: hypothetical protein ABEH35_09035 [Haloarculaceae archaeon]
MRLHNSEGTGVDPVPFLVVAAVGVAVCVSFVPPYVLALGASLTVGVASAVVGTVLVTALAYYRFVWTARPALRRERPADTRLQRLVYGGAICVGVLVLLSLPLLAG